MVRGTQFNISLEGHRVLSLRERVQELVQADRLALLVALREILPLKQLRDGRLGAKFDHAQRPQLNEPLAVEADLGHIRVQNLEHLLLVGFGVFENLVARHLGACRIPPAGVAYESSHVTDEKHHCVP